VRITVDTNILVRGVVRDDLDQAKAVDQLLHRAEIVAVSTACLCELVWVLRSRYRIASNEISAAVRALHDTEYIQMDRRAVLAGLASLEAGGDFADGAIAHEGRWFGGDTFVSFDKKAVTLIADQGHSSLLLNP
jgi:predicted nucleic-acid-binding protein